MVRSKVDSEANKSDKRLIHRTHRTTKQWPIFAFASASVREPLVDLSSITVQVKHATIFANLSNGCVSFQ